jgi:plastocyanin
MITKAGFSPSCAKITAKSKFFFVNNERSHHTATTSPGSPTSFDADLRKKGSTYFQVFKKKGTYHIRDKVTKKTMTLFVVG